MRLWPRSIAGRSSLILIAGVIAVLWAGAMVGWLADPDERGPRGSWLASETAASLVVMIDRTPPENRKAALRAAATKDYQIVWTPNRPSAQLSDRGWQPRMIARTVRRSLEARGLTTVEAGMIEAADKDVDMTVAVRVQLSDGSWLEFLIPDRRHRARGLLAFLGVILVVGLGLSGLAILISRRVTAPLGRFSAAAVQLGTDVDAPPMDEKGPTEIRKAAQAFNQMQHRVRRFVEDRTQMLAAISHDLRTMLTRLRLRADYIDDPQQQAKMLADVAEMQDMLDATLSFARDNASAEPSTPVDLSSLLQTLCDDLSDAGHSVTFDGPQRVTLECRPVALRRALANLIDNAIKYGGTADIGLIDGQHDVTIEIADRGPGIPTSSREQVFAPFFRLEDSRSRETGGTGLGLALARNIVRGHGGDITLHDRDGGGLVVRVTLPRREIG